MQTLSSWRARQISRNWRSQGHVLRLPPECLLFQRGFKYVPPSVRPRSPPPPPPSFWRGLVDDGPVPRSLYFPHESTILQPQFSGRHAWGCLLSLTGVNTLVWMMWGEIDHEWMIDNFSTNLTNVREGRVWTPATASISHQNVGHLAGNLFALWLFGFKTARVIGAWSFYSLYLAGGIACSSAHLLSNKLAGRTEPRLIEDESMRLQLMVEAGYELSEEVQYRLARIDKPSLGASGSVMAISAVAAALFPLDRIRFRRNTFSAFIPLPAAVSMYVASDLMGLTIPVDSPVDHAGHLGGLLMGCFFVYTAWYSKSGSFRILHSQPTGGDLPIIYRYKQWRRNR
eukprot:gb/GEZN01008583.1/.p1 GENE.gb/GEZN01008583.1/~~gb/GEZN01008583.1/.p1  ORF type:complete len:342 (+),score=11.84 gb/GEZN01008583.1/:189-1214(+)